VVVVFCSGEISWLNSHSLPQYECCLLLNVYAEQQLIRSDHMMYLELLSSNVTEDGLTLNMNSFRQDSFQWME